MLAEKMAARAQGRALRTDEAERYRAQVRDVLPHVEAERRGAAGLRMAWGEEGLLIAVEPSAEDGELVRLTSTPQHFTGLRWWFICPKCGGRSASLYWLGHGRRGWWQCRGCCGLRYPSSSLHKTPEGDRMMLRGEVRSDFPALQRAMERQAKRRAKVGGGLLNLAGMEKPASWAETRAKLLEGVVGER